MRAITTLILLALVATLPACQRGGTDTDATSREDTEPRPQPPSGPPFPKAVVDQSLHNFGVMLPQSTGKHDFRITNEGEFPLELQQGKSSCTCTVSGLTDNKLEKGETATITLKWQPKQPNGRFDESVEIYTNDPALLTIRLQISGRIENLLTVMPVGRWAVGTVEGDKTAKVEGLVYSAVREKFGIKSLTYDEKQIDVTSAPLSKTELTDLKAKSGYKITVTIKAKTAIGSFSEALKIKTDLDDGIEVPVEVVGSRTGPVLIRPGIGTRWRSDTMRLTLGRFPASRGASSTLILRVSGLGDEELKIENIKTDPEFLHVGELKPRPVKQPGVIGGQAATQTRRKVYELSVSVPPNSAPASRLGTNRGVVTLHLNHKWIRSLRFSVAFDSY